MKKLVAITSLICGLLLVIIPRFILPACEYAGYPHMHCSDAARAEYIAGVLLMLTGCGTLFLKRETAVMAGALAAGILFGVAYWLPDITGYCLSPRMPCNYGTVPGVRVVAVAGFTIMAVALAGLVKSWRRKKNA
jgi:hypothetical protein